MLEYNREKKTVTKPDTKSVKIIRKRIDEGKNNIIAKMLDKLFTCE